MKLKSSFFWPLIGSLLFSLCFACTTPVNKNKALEKEVIDIHDEAMVWLDEISDLSKAVKDLRPMVGESAPPSLEDQIMKHLSSLNHADKIMWDWMHEYKKPSDRSSMSTEQEKAYLERELVRVKAMRETMFKHKEAAKAFLKNMTNE